MNKPTLTIGGAIVALLVSLILRYQGIITDQHLLNAGIVIAFTWLCWVFGMGGAEVHKRAFIPRPWTPGAAEERFIQMFGVLEPETDEQRITYHDLMMVAERARDRIYFAACLWGGLPLTAVLVAHFHPDTPIGWLLSLIYGIGIGGFALPTVYRVLFHDVWPWIRHKVFRRGGVEIRRDGDGRLTAIKDHDAPSPRTELVGQGKPRRK